MLHFPQQCYISPTIQTKMEIIPGGVSFTFSSAMPCFCPNLQNIPENSHLKINPNDSLTIQQQIAMKQLELQKLENILLRENMNKNKYSIVFHHNKNNSTSDLEFKNNRIIQKKPSEHSACTQTNINKEYKNISCQTEEDEQKLESNENTRNDPHSI